MPSHRLTPASGGSKERWLLEWDDKHLILHDPDGLPVLDIEAALAHRVIDLSKTFIDGTIYIGGPNGTLSFKQNRAAQADLHKLVESGLRSDPEYRADMRRNALRAMPAGVAMFLIPGGLFATYCWYISWAPDPAPDSWLRSFGGVIKGGLAVLMAVTLLGLGVGVYGLRQWLRIRRIERTLAAGDAHADNSGTNAARL